MSAIGTICSLAFWALAALSLSEYEGNVRVLRPWQRTVYGVAAFAAGLVFGLLVAGWRP